MTKNVTLETPRLILRKLELSDAKAMYENWTSDEKVAAFVSWNAHRSVEETQTILNRWVKEYEEQENPLRFGICLKDSGTLIGMIDVVGEKYGFPEVGYVLSSKHWGQGIMTEAATAFRDYLFSLNHRRIIIRALGNNIGSTKVIFKLGGMF